MKFSPSTTSRSATGNKLSTGGTEKRELFMHYVLIVYGCIKHLHNYVLIRSIHIICPYYAMVLAIMHKEETCLTLPHRNQ